MPNILVPVSMEGGLEVGTFAISPTTEGGSRTPYQTCPATLPCQVQLQLGLALLCGAREQKPMTPNQVRLWQPVVPARLQKPGARTGGLGRQRCPPGERERALASNSNEARRGGERAIDAGRSAQIFLRHPRAVEVEVDIVGQGSIEGTWGARWRPAWGKRALPSPRHETLLGESQVGQAESNSSQMAVALCARPWGHHTSSRGWHGVLKRWRDTTVPRLCWVLLPLEK